MDVLASQIHEQIVEDEDHSTRFRALLHEEKIVGFPVQGKAARVCLTAHFPASQIQKQIVEVMQFITKNRSRKCPLPSYQSQLLRRPGHAVTFEKVCRDDEVSFDHPARPFFPSAILDKC